MNLWASLLYDPTESLLIGDSLEPDRFPSVAASTLRRPRDSPTEKPYRTRNLRKSLDVHSTEA